MGMGKTSCRKQIERKEADTGGVSLLLLFHLPSSADACYFEATALSFSQSASSFSNISFTREL